MSVPNLRMILYLSCGCGGKFVFSFMFKKLYANWYILRLQEYSAFIAEYFVHPTKVVSLVGGIEFRILENLFRFTFLLFRLLLCLQKMKSGGEI